MKRLKKIKWWLVGLLALISLLLALFFPLPYYIEMPGGAYDIRTVLQVNGKEDKRKGAYQFVAVGISRASLAQLLYAWLTPFTEISTAEDTTGGYSDADFLRINQFYMETSQNAAIYQALSLAGKPVTLDYKGVYVLDVNNESTFKGTLHLADTVTGVNGKQFTSSAELIDYVSHLKLGDEVTVQFTSDNKPKKGVGRIIKLKNGKNGIGIALTDHTSVNSEDTVIFSTKGVGGPSAGLMFTLDIYDQITKEDLRKGRIIAGTGTIGKDGEVGDIGGADIFFVPNNPVDKEIKKVNPNAISNYEEAKRAAKRLKTKMKIVPVTTVQEALVYLRK